MLRGERALFVWEGVIAYLDAAAVDRSLRFVVNAGGRGSRLAFDFAAGSPSIPSRLPSGCAEPGSPPSRPSASTRCGAYTDSPASRTRTRPIMQMGVAEV
jgi:O-methyltransferase involved in polyketide biosynthesis